ncbi:MAG: porphobilinogen synthase [Gemmatimonadetes bacterium]|nr:porphobilinogen synthase [Gemmatimonadota bacterium]
MEFPNYRHRRLRQSETWRRAVRETRLSIDDFVYPMFVTDGTGVTNSIDSMPDIYQQSIDRVVEEAREVRDLGIPGVLLFGVPDESTKDAQGSAGYDPEGIIPKAIKAIKAVCPDLLVWADVCLCEYTNHGHCGVLGKNGEVENDTSLPILSKMALAYANAGADAVAPSDMMDGRVGVIREVLDNNQHSLVPIISYAAKYSSSYYGPFRDIANSCPSSGDRKSYQMDPANADEAIREVDQDIMEGADMIIVKPAGSYLDILWRVKQSFAVPIAAYQVSGEYAMIKAAGQNGWLDEEEAMTESLLSIKRAGADLIISYFAKDIAKRLKGSSGS